MKRFASSFWGVLSLCMALSVFNVSCIGDGNDTIVLENNQPSVEEIGSATRVVASDESQTFSSSGYIITIPKGAVPRTTSGTVGRVAFSLSQSDELPTSLPAGTSLIDGGNIKFEPMNFTFNSPLMVKIPLHGNAASEVIVYRYNEYTGTWELVPITSINNDGTVTISVIELGQFIVVKKTEQGGMGGIHIDKRYIENGYFYYLTLVSKTSSTGTKSIAFTSNGSDLYMSNVSLGQYVATVTRERRESNEAEALTIESLTERFNVSVSSTLVKGNGNYSTYTGWTEITWNISNWNTGRPDAWGEVTKTYGTGKFQATLTWVNATNNTTDYDLHLTTPSGKEVFYGNKSVGAFELDRDWISELGNAVENIYSVNDDFEAGTYKVRVHHYGGATGKRFNCRVILDGIVVKSITGVQDSGYYDIYTFNVN